MLILVLVLLLLLRFMIFRRWYFVALLLHAFLFNVKESAYAFQFGPAEFSFSRLVFVFLAAAASFLLVSFALVFSFFFAFLCVAVASVAHALHLIGSNVSSQITNGAYFDIIIFGILGSCMPVQIAATMQQTRCFLI